MCVDPIDTVIVTMGHNICDIISLKLEPKSVQSSIIDFSKMPPSRITKQLKLITLHLKILRTTCNLTDTLICRLLVLYIILLNKYNLVDGGTLSKYLQEFEC